MDVSEAARQLKVLREQARLPMRAVADSLGWTLTRYQHYEDRYRRAHLPLDLVRRLAEIFAHQGIDPRSVLELAGVDRALPLKAGAPLAVPPLVAAGRDLPVMGAAKGGAEGFFFNEGEAKEYVPRPSNLSGVADAFALYVNGDSMEPRYFAGELVYVHPNRPLTRSCFVAVETKDGRGMLKQFLRRSDDHIILHQFNPEKDIRLARREVKRILRVVGSGEIG